MAGGDLYILKDPRPQIITMTQRYAHPHRPIRSKLLIGLNTLGQALRLRPARPKCPENSSVTAASHPAYEGTLVRAQARNDAGRPYKEMGARRMAPARAIIS